MVDLNEYVSALDPRSTVGRARDGVASLIQPSDSPEAQAYSRESTHYRAIDEEYDINRPSDDIEEYYEIYQTNPLIARPIENLVTQVVEPGYYFTADSEGTVDDLLEFAENVAMVNGKVRQPLSELLRKAVIEHQVRGTFLCERITDDDGNPQALNPVQVSTFETYSKPDSNVLLEPDQTDLDNVKITDDNKAAAYVQFDEALNDWTEREERRFARNQILKWARYPDVGDVFGTSRIEHIYLRAKALDAKLRDNDDAIAMKAWPGIIISAGTEDNPFSQDELEALGEDFDAESFGPGMIELVSGNVDVEEFAGETADIESAVRTDVNYVHSGMPGPKFSLGSFPSEDGVELAQAKERQFKKLVRDLRRDLEDLLTPYFRDVAEAYNLDAPDSVQLHVGRPAGEVAPEDVRGNVIRYTSDTDTEDETGPGTGLNSSEDIDGFDEDADPSDSDDGGDTGQASGGPTDRSPSAPGSSDAMAGEGDGAVVADAFEVSPEAAELLDNGIQSGVAELADPRLVSTTDIVDELAESIRTVLVRVRDDTISDLTRGRSTSASRLAPQVTNTASDVLSSARNDVDLDSRITDALDQAADRTAETLSQETHRPRIEAPVAGQQSVLVDSVRSQLRRDVREAVDDQAEDMRNLLEAQVGSDEPLDRWAERVRSTLDESTIRNRARTIAHMRVARTVNATKLDAYRRHDDVAGVEVINPCTASTTELCERLAGCDSEGATEAMFDSDTSIAAQLQSTVPNSMLFAGFDPLSYPPFHFGCRSELVPVLDE